MNMNIKLLSVLLASVLFLAACGSDSSDSTKEEDKGDAADYIGIWLSECELDEESGSEQLEIVFKTETEISNTEYKYTDDECEGSGETDGPTDMGYVLGKAVDDGEIEGYEVDLDNEEGGKYQIISKLRQEGETKYFYVGLEEDGKKGDSADTRPTKFDQSVKFIKQEQTR